MNALQRMRSERESAKPVKTYLVKHVQHQVLVHVEVGDQQVQPSTILPEATGTSFPTA